MFITTTAMGLRAFLSRHPKARDQRLLN
jgi:hypothetical protein